MARHWESSLYPDRALEGLRRYGRASRRGVRCYCGLRHRSWLRTSSPQPAADYVAKSDTELDTSADSTAIAAIDADAGRGLRRHAGEPRTTPSRPPEEARRRAAGRGALALLAGAADSTTATAAGGLPLR